MGRAPRDAGGAGPARWRRLWRLDPDIAFLNHGSFGAVPRDVEAEQDRLRAEIERNPVRFLARELADRLDAARRELADFVGADGAGLVFVSNATTGVATVLGSLEVGPGDELLTTDHAYPACRRALDRLAARSGAQLVVAHVPFPLANPSEITAAILDKVGPRTRLAMIDHVTSPTAVVFPVAEIAAALQGRDVPVLVDGAHAPGMVDLAIDRLGVAAYTGNCHKWLCAPRGAGFLWLCESWRSRVRPLVTSHGAGGPWGERPPLWAEFDWTGTFDPTPWLCVPAAIRWLGGLLPGGWAALRDNNHRLAVHARKVVCDLLEAEPPCPDEMLGAMAAIPLPEGDDELQRRLLDEHGIEVPVIGWPAPPRRLLRLSAQLYNDTSEYARLGEALRGLW